MSSLPRIDTGSDERAQRDAMIRLMQYTFGMVRVPLGDVASIVMGDPNAKKGTLPSGNIPLLNRGIGVKGYVDRANHDGELIAVSTRGKYCGWPAWYDGPVFVSDTLAITARPELATTRYLFLALDAGKNELNRMDNGGVIPELTVNDVLRFVIPLPTLEEQSRIVSALDGVTAQDGKMAELYDRARTLAADVIFKDMRQDIKNEQVRRNDALPH